ncbi:hypothetical protein BXY82_0851 [Gelidibacter sediminis]|uniref:Hotdog family 3-hydroxylacyl-ACP dehydratase n=1 Tax=Gelidibacter sediminis TaxID=1608710 RepID=A0A4R7Q920_9FLAO|nr:hypothetical protein [Gelidibacter sediminis]TDU43439.1 hypothetical protein BXY82_0851 [Gelidibacter sediminis]
MKTPITDLSDLKKLLPHREPMMMVDSLLDFSEGRATVGFTIVKENIFVANNEFSETGLIEHMAQAAALYTGFKNLSNLQPVKEGFIASIKTLKIQHLPEVNSVLKTEVAIVNELMHLTTVNLSIFKDNIKIANADMNLVLKE